MKRLYAVITHGKVINKPMLELLECKRSRMRVSRQDAKVAKEMGAWKSSGNERACKFNQSQADGLALWSSRPWPLCRWPSIGLVTLGMAEDE